MEMAISNSDVCYIYKNAVLCWFEELTGKKGFTSLNGILLSGDGKKLADILVKYLNIRGKGGSMSSKLGTRVLTVNTPGRTWVNFSTYKEDGSFTYNMTPAYSSTKYRVRAFLAYTDASGNTVYAYSDPITVSYNTLR